MPNQTRRTFLTRSGMFLAGAATISALPKAAGAADSTVLAVIGDYGSGLIYERQVADLVASWEPDFIATAGDNVYSAEDADPWGALTRKVGNFYRPFIDGENFFPSLGNHDWGDPGRPLLYKDAAGQMTGAWLNYFSTPGNGRYYNVRRGPVELFILDDYFREPDGNRIGSVQADWLRDAAQASTAPWKVVVHHYPSWSSAGRGGVRKLRWPFKEWGINGVIAGHHHHYERLVSDGTNYFVNGLGGAHKYGIQSPIIAESRSRFWEKHGAMRISATATDIRYEFVDVNGVVRDSHLVTAGVVPPPPDPEPQPIPRSPDTALTAPDPGAIVGRNVTITGTAVAQAGIASVEVILKNLSDNRYYNETTGSWQRSFHKMKVIPQNPGGQDVWWTTTVADVAAGEYRTRAWARSTDGRGDPSGDAIADFSVR